MKTYKDNDDHISTCTGCGIKLSESMKMAHILQLTFPQDRQWWALDGFTNPSTWQYRCEGCRTGAVGGRRSTRSSFRRTSLRCVLVKRLRDWNTGVVLVVEATGLPFRNLSLCPKASLVFPWDEGGLVVMLIPGNPTVVVLRLGVWPMIFGQLGYLLNRGHQYYWGLD